jgi:hypothetical protein
MTIDNFLWHNRWQAIVFLSLITFCSNLSAQTVVILADTPYSDKEKQMLQGPDGILYRLINAQKPSIVMHLGDFKSGGDSCTNELLIEHKALLAQIQPGKIIYTPGDNDWTDCDRFWLFHSYDELERLEYLTKLMFKTPPLLSEGLTDLTEQSTQIENKLWINDRLAISTLHIVGTSNGRDDIKKSTRQSAIKNADNRDKANLDWLKNIEEKSKNFDALIIGFQADIYQQKVIKSPPCQDSSEEACDAFSIYRQAFQDLAKRIKKPILISHGDTGDFCFEQLDYNLWHLNAAGDFRYLDATKISYNPKSVDRPFTAKGLLNPELPTIGCNN